MASVTIGRIAIVGSGRVGTVLANGLRRAGLEVTAPLGRGATGEGADVILLCVPDREIGDASSHLMGDAIVGHCSASTPLTVLEPHERFRLHPLLSIAHRETSLAGGACAVDGSTPRAQEVATELGRRLGMRPAHVNESHRALYHAAASMASNFLVTLETLAERLAVQAGIDRSALLPLVRGTIDNWAELGERALTGPVARGDDDTVSRQRDAVAHAAPDLLPLWDELTRATRVLANDLRSGEGE